MRSSEVAVEVVKVNLVVFEIVAELLEVEQVVVRSGNRLAVDWTIPWVLVWVPV